MRCGHSKMQIAHSKCGGMELGKKNIIYTVCIEKRIWIPFFVSKCFSIKYSVCTEKIPKILLVKKIKMTTSNSLPQHFLTFFFIFKGVKVTRNVQTLQTIDCKCKWLFCVELSMWYFG